MSGAISHLLDYEVFKRHYGLWTSSGGTHVTNWNYVSVFNVSDSINFERTYGVNRYVVTYHNRSRSACSCLKDFTRLNRTIIGCNVNPEEISVATDYLVRSWRRTIGNL